MSDLVLLALLVIGEAADQPFEAQLGVAYVALNRLSFCASCTLWDVVVRSGEFAAINAAQRLPESYIGCYWQEPRKLWESRAGRLALLAAMKALSSWPGGDPTNGATHFENLAFGEPYWASSMRKTVRLGDLTFYKVEDERGKTCERTDSWRLPGDHGWLSRWVGRYDPHRPTLERFFRGDNTSLDEPD